ncbi:type II toxin-antitoxin system RelE/ParE family toxin [Candidatus Chlorohelix sp.]|uniref:type II toxin-antitoxin system RelE/ParE family toxin n=1 Tax=Candidatus Chlorohelix sp. TaxID=3139201 RepID=UPI00303EF5BA
MLPPFSTRVSCWLILDPDFEKWLCEQEEGVQDSIFAHAGYLGTFGPSLGRLQVDTIKGSKLPNLKELRVSYRGEPWRVLFVFDPKRQAILLIGGNKGGDARWYKKNIPIAEQRYERHLKQMEKENGEKA